MHFYNVRLRNMTETNKPRYLLHDVLTPNTQCRLKKAVLTKELNKIDSFVFEIYYTHPHYDKIKLHTSFIEVDARENDLYIDDPDEFWIKFDGRVIKITENMDEDGLLYKTVVCENVLGCLIDTIQPYTPETLYEGDAEHNISGLEEFIQLLIDNHNTQCDTYAQIDLFYTDVQTHETNNNVYKGLNYQTTYETITEKLVEVFGGEIFAEYDRNDCTIQFYYYTEMNGRYRTKINLGRNMKHITQTKDTTEVITKLIPLGCKLKDQDGNETEERLTIEDVNDGKNYLISQGYYELYGSVTKTVIFDDVTTPTILKQKGNEYLADNNSLVITTELGAVNLYELGIDEYNFIRGDYTFVTHDLFNINQWLRINKVVVNCLNPIDTTLSLDKKHQTFSDIVTNLQKEQTNTTRNIDIVKTDVYNVDNKYNTITDTLTTTTSQLEQTTSSLTGRVTQTETSIGTLQTTTSQMSTALQMTAQGVSVTFEEVNTRQDNNESRLDAEIQQRTKCIDMVDGVINLNNSESPMTLSIENDKIAFKKNGLVVSEWDSIEDIFKIGNILVDVNKKAQFGRFAFVPYYDDTLSFLKLSDDSE